MSAVLIHISWDGAGFTRAADIRLKKWGVNLARIDESPSLGIKSSYVVLTRGQKKKLIASGEGRVGQWLGIKLVFCQLLDEEVEAKYILLDSHLGAGFVEQRRACGSAELRVILAVG